MPTLEHDLLSAFIAGIQRKSISSTTEWATKYRVMGKPFPGPYDPSITPWTREIQDCRATRRTIPKGAQLGLSEAALNRILYKIDVERVDCLYLLPTKNPDASDFSASRFDAALDLSPHLKMLFSDVKNVGHKRAGSTNLYIRGMQSKAALRSIPAQTVIGDEYDLFDEANVRLVEERMSGQLEKEFWKLSTPTIDGWGIYAAYAETTKEHFFFKCPCCGRQTELVFPDSLIITADSINDPNINRSRYQCLQCKKELPYHWTPESGDLAKKDYLKDAIWVPTAEQYDLDNRGFYINQYYSIPKTPVELARKHILAQFNPVEKREYYNSCGGLPFSEEGGQLTHAEFTQCIKDYPSIEIPSTHNIITMGVDVGGLLHVEIDEWTVTLGPDINTNSNCRVIRVLELQRFEDLDKLMRQYQVRGCVIDAQPERRKSKEFADRFYGFVRTCFYTGGKGKLLALGDEHTMSADRTALHDLSMNRFRTNRITLPNDLPPHYQHHLQALERVTRKREDTGELIAKYINNKPDHFAHARAYAEAALPLAASIAVNGDINNFL